MRASDQAHQALQRYLKGHPIASANAAPPDELLALAEDERATLLVDVLRMRSEDGGYGPGPFFSLEVVERALWASLREMPLPQLCAALVELGGVQGMCGYDWKAAWNHAKKRIRKKGIEPELYGALRVMQPAMGSHQSDRNAAIAMDLVLWFETHLPLDEQADATACIKRDLRAMGDKERKAWQKLLEHAQSCDRAEPSEGWLSKAPQLADSVGREAFQQRLQAWLGTISRRDKAPAVAPGGVDVLRGLVWHTTWISNDAIDEAVRRLAALPFKRGAGWSPRHDRWVGAIAYALGKQNTPEVTKPLLIELQRRFGKTTAKYAIDGALQRGSPEPP